MLGRAVLVAATTAAFTAVPTAVAAQQPKPVGTVETAAFNLSREVSGQFTSVQALGPGSLTCNGMPTNRDRFVWRWASTLGGTLYSVWTEISAYTGAGTYPVVPTEFNRVTPAVGLYRLTAEHAVVAAWASWDHVQRASPGTMTVSGPTADGVLTLKLDAQLYRPPKAGVSPEPGVRIVGTATCRLTEFGPAAATPGVTTVPTGQPAASAARTGTNGSARVVSELASGEDPDRDATALRGFVDGRRMRTTLAAAVRGPAEIPWTPDALAVSALIALALLLVLFPAHLFNATLEENYDEVVGWLPWRRGPPPAERTHQWMGLVAVAAVTAALAQLLDPHARLDRATVAGVAGVATAIVVLTLISSVPNRLWLHRKYSTTATLRAYPAALVIAIACVAISRAVGFEPGYLYGIVGGFVVARAISDRDSGLSSTIGVLFGVALAGAAWVAHGQVVEQAETGAALWLGADAFLAAIYGGALGGLIFGLLPLRVLPGGTIARWRRSVWAALFAFAAFGFVHTLLTPDVGARQSMFVTTALFVGFGVVSLVFWGYFRFRPAREAASEPAAEGAAEPAAAFPPPDWTERTVADLRALLPGLDNAELLALRAAERAGKNRISLLRDIDAHLGHREPAAP